MDYSSQLSNPLWQKKRLLIMERDKFRCQSCQSEIKTLNVHHKCYFEFLKAWEYPDDLLITLCHECHRNEGKSPQLYSGLATALQMNGFLYSDLLCLATMLYDKKFTRSMLRKLRQIQTPVNG